MNFLALKWPFFIGSNHKCYLAQGGWKNQYLSKVTLGHIICGMNLIQHAIELAGGPVALTRELNKRISKPITYQAVLKWARQGHLPRTEWTGETSYAKALSAAVNGQIKVRALLVRPTVTEALDAPQAQSPARIAQAATETVAQGVA